jgi:SAM-dependent methyltransferase
VVAKGIPLLSAPHRLFDRDLLSRRRLRAQTQGPETFLLDAAAQECAARLQAVTRKFEQVCEIEPLGGALGAALERAGLPQISRFARSDTGHEDLALEAESIGCALSLLSLHWLNDLPGALAQIRRALKPDGLLLLALLGGDTLIELRESFAAAELERDGGLSPRVIPFADVRALGGLLQRAGFALPVADLERLTVRYDSALHVMRDLRRMGATNVLIERSRRPLRRATLLRAAEIYAERFSDADGRVRATFDVIWLSGWAPHASQQQPLKPGSARQRLADALGATEIKAGEKAGPGRETQS